MAENVCSAVADVTGIVRVMCTETVELYFTALYNVTNSPQVCMVSVVNIS